jgi:ABC-type transporter Mla subunit MlaD
MIWIPLTIAALIGVAIGFAGCKLLGARAKKSLGSGVPNRSRMISDLRQLADRLSEQDDRHLLRNAAMVIDAQAAQITRLERERMPGPTARS